MTPIRTVLTAAALIVLATQCAPTDEEADTSAGDEQREVVVEQAAAATPQACLDALDSGEDALALAAEAMDVATEWAPMIAEAAQAGMDLDVSTIESISGRLEDGTATLEGLTAELLVVRDEYQSAAAECREQG